MKPVIPVIRKRPDLADKEGAWVSSCCRTGHPSLRIALNCVRIQYARAQADTPPRVTPRFVREVRRAA